MWWFNSFIISIAGFTLVGALCVFQEVDLLTTVLRSIAAFVALWVVLSFLRGILHLAGYEGQVSQQTERVE